MAYICAKFRKAGKYGPYFHEVESVREGETVHQLHIRYIGKMNYGFAAEGNVRIKVPVADAIRTTVHRAYGKALEGTLASLRKNPGDAKAKAEYAKLNKVSGKGNGTEEQYKALLDVNPGAAGLIKKQVLAHTEPTHKKALLAGKVPGTLAQAVLKNRKG